MECPGISNSPDILKMEFVEIKEEPRYEEEIPVYNMFEIKQEPANSWSLHNVHNPERCTDVKLELDRKIKVESAAIANQDISEDQLNFKVSIKEHSIEIDDHCLDYSENNRITCIEESLGLDVTKVDGKNSVNSISSIETKYSKRKSNRPKRNFKCRICSKTYAQSSHLKSHMVSHTGIKEHKCEICSKEFGQFSHLNSHIAIHTGIKEHKCEICGKEFGRSSHLKSHMVTHTGIKEYKCEICGKEFGQSSHRNTHMITHDKIVKLQKCDICNKTFRLLVHLKAHMVTHTGPNSCNKEAYKPHWDEKLEQEAYLNADHDISEDLQPNSKVSIKDEIETDGHYLDWSENSRNVTRNNESSEVDITGNDVIKEGFNRTSIGVRPKTKQHQCEICSKEFSRSGHLISHMVTHTGIKEYKCEVCKKEFGRIGDLKTHMIIHTGIKPHKCDICNKAFSRSPYLKSHKRIHSNKRYYKDCK